MSANYYTWLQEVNRNQRLTVENIANFFDLIPEEEINKFTYQKRDGSLIGIKDYFKAHHHNQISRYSKDEMETAKNKFLLIYNGAAWDVLKIIEQKKLLNKLIDLENNWRDTTQHEGDNNFNADDINKIEENNTHEDIRGIANGILTGQVDASQLSKVDAKNLLEYSREKVLGFLDPNTRSRSHQITLEGGKNTLTFRNSHTNTITNRHITKNKHITHFSNTSKDIIDVINLNLPNIIETFLDKFNPMFLY